MKIEHIAGLADACPRRSRIGLLIFNHAFFVGASDRMGVEITIASKRFEPGGGHRRTYFRIQRHSATGAAGVSENKGGG